MSVFGDIWSSFRRLPLGVQAWVALWLGPVNIASVAFIGEPNGLWIFLLAIGGMVPNGPIMAKERGMSALMALPHLIVWVPLLIVVAITLTQDIGSGHLTYLVILGLTDLLSLLFDAKDFKEWLGGNRQIA